MANLVAIHNTPVNEDAARNHATMCSRCETELNALPSANARRAFEILNNVCLHAAGSNSYIKAFARKDGEE